MSTMSRFLTLFHRLRIEAQEFVRREPLLVYIVVVGILVRAYAFGSIPPGLNQDEASSAYDAFALLTHGIDRNGFPYPVMLVSWGSGMHALAGYISMPFLWLFGLSIFSTRLPHLLIGILTLPLFFVYMTDIAGRRAGMIALFLLVIAPWHIMISRWGLESNQFPPLFLLGTFLAARSEKIPKLLPYAFACFALCLYAYGTSYIVIAAFLTMSVPWMLWKKKWRLHPAIISCVVFAAIALPIALYLLINTRQLPSIVTPFFSIPRLSGVPRFQTMGNLGIGSWEFYVEAGKNLATAWRLFLTQDDGLIWNAIPGYGILYVLSPPFMAIGLVSAIFMFIRRRSASLFLLLAWFLSAVVLTAFVSVNINRVNIIMFPLIAFAAIGVSVLWRSRVAFGLVIATFLFLFVRFTVTYFIEYPKMIGPAFFESLTEAIAEAAAADPTGTICVTGNVNMPYIFALFATKEDPNVFVRTVKYGNPGAEFQGVESYGRFLFGLDRCGDPSIRTFVIRQDELGSLRAGSSSVQPMGQYAVVRFP